jgi:hypothetical protein
MKTVSLPVDLEAKTIKVPHLGYSLRTLMGCVVAAAAADPALKGRRLKFNVIYGVTVVGSIRLKTL